MPPHILIVDDEPQVTFFLHQMLRLTKPDYVISTAQTGEEALRLTQREAPDLVITDYCLKDMDGLLLAAALKRLERTPSVIMITAGPLPPAEGVRKSDVLHCIQKPFSAAQLMAVIGDTLEKDDSASDPGDGATLGRGSHLQDPNTAPRPQSG